MIKHISLALVLVFAIFGMMSISTALHEYSHYYDFKEIAQPTELCGMVLPTNVSELLSGKSGYYHFNINKSNETEYDRISEYTESKAYFFDILVCAIGLICIIVVAKNYVENG